MVSDAIPSRGINCTLRPTPQRINSATNKNIGFCTTKYMQLVPLDSQERMPRLQAIKNEDDRHPHSPTALDSIFYSSK